MKKLNCVVIGECMIELSGSPFSALKQTCGGDVLNTAIYLARCAEDIVDIRFVTVIGTDPLSEGMRRRWQQEKINTDWLVTDPSRLPGVYFIQTNEVGERSFLYWRDNSAAKYLLQHVGYAALREEIAGADWIYLSGISLAILPQDDRQRLLQDLAFWQKNGATIIFDSNYRPALWREPEEARHVFSQMYQCSDLLLVTDEDEAALWQEADPEQTLKRLSLMSQADILVKMGAKGCVYQPRDRQQNTITIPTLPVDPVVDSTSAGDAFNAGVLSGLARNHPLSQAASWGHLLAGRVIQHPGAIIPVAAMQDLISSFKSSKG